MYNQVTGDNAKPIAIGGGTYARALKCGCGFGPEMAGDEATIHQANEYVTFAQIERMSEIYYKAIKAVCVKDGDACANSDACEVACDDEACGTENSVPAKAHIATVKVGYTDKKEPEKTALASVKVGYTDKVEPKKTKLWTITKKLS